MSQNKSKVKGSAWEAQAVAKLNELISGSSFRRVPGSGAIGTSMHEPLLTGDIKGMVEGFFKHLKGEAKTGYGGETQLTVKKEWIDKIKLEASYSHAFPFLICKFLGSRTGVKHFVILDIDSFAEMINEYTELRADFDETYNELQELKSEYVGNVKTSL